MTDKEIDTSDIPELNADFFSNARLTGCETRGDFQLRIDPKIVAWFQLQGTDWEQRIEDALRKHILTHPRSAGVDRRERPDATTTLNTTPSHL